MEHFEIWFGGLFLGLGLMALLIFAALYVGLARIARIRPYRWAFLGAPLGIGVIFSVMGGGIAGYGVWEYQTEQRLRAEGTVARATVTEVERTWTRINGRYQWRARYEYQDHEGRTHQGSSTLLSPGQAQTWKAGDEAFIRYDPASPSTSIWLGHEDPAQPI